MKKWKTLVLLLLAIALVIYMDQRQYLTLEYLKLNRDRLEDFYKANTLTMIGGYIAAYIMIGLFLLPGATFLSFAAGLIFGPALGVGIVVIGSTLGATLAFLVSRYLLRDWVVENGLASGERVITQGLQKVRPDMTVNPVLRKGS